VDDLLLVGLGAHGQVDRQDHAVHREGPDVQVVQPVNIVHLEQIFVNAVVANVLGGSLDQNLDRVSDDDGGGAENDYRKDDGADGIRDFASGEDLDDDGGDEDTDGLEEITEDMD